MIKTEPFSESKLLKIRGWFNVKLDWEPGNSKRLQNQWLGNLEPPKQYKTNGLGAWRPQNVTKTMVWEPGGSKTLQKQWFGSLEAPEPYKNNGLGAPWLPDPPPPLSWGVGGREP